MFWKDLHDESDRRVVVASKKTASANIEEVLLGNVVPIVHMSSAQVLGELEHEVLVIDLAPVAMSSVMKAPFLPRLIRVDALQNLVRKFIVLENQTDAAMPLDVISRDRVPVFKALHLQTDSHIIQEEPLGVLAFPEAARRANEPPWLQSVSESDHDRVLANLPRMFRIDSRQRSEDRTA